MKKQLMTKKKLDGSTFMVMFLGSRSTSPSLLLPLDVALSCLLCKDV